MFLSTISEHGLLPHRKDTHILKRFHPGGIRMMVSVMVKELEDGHVPTMLPTAGHVRWAMELIGAGFTLPIEEYPVINSALAIYTRWLLSNSPDERPVPIVQDEAPFFKDMFGHISLLFAFRGNSMLLKQHTDLCIKALNVLLEVGRLQLSVETWETLLAVALGIAHHLLKERQHTHSAYGNTHVHSERSASSNGISSGNGGHLLARSLEQPLAVLVFDLWFRGKTTNEHLWKSFSKLAGKWVHRVDFYQNYRIVCLALTKRVIRLLGSKRQRSHQDSSDQLV